MDQISTFADDPIYTATGCIAAPIAAIASMIWVTSTVTAACDDPAVDPLDYISLFSGDVKTSPHILVTAGRTYGSEKNSISTYNDTGSCEVWFTMDAVGEVEKGDAFLYFLEFVGGVIDDVKALSGTGTYPNIQRITQIGEPQRPDATSRESEDYYTAGYTFDWGI
jgi:hypothetical protein